MLEQLISTRNKPEPTFCSDDNHADLACRILINTPGSGNTKLLLELLCVSWGMYFVCMPFELGSNDLHMAMTTKLESLHGYFHRVLPTGQEGTVSSQTLLKINRYAARWQFSLV
jgi:hypothetical protein